MFKDAYEVNNVALRIVSAAEAVEKTLQIVRQKLEVEEKTIAEYLDSIIAEFDKYMNNQRYFAGRPLRVKMRLLTIVYKDVKNIVWLIIKEIILYWKD